MTEKTKRAQAPNEAAASGSGPASDAKTAPKAKPTKAATTRAAAKANTLLVLENEDPWTDAELAEQKDVLEAESLRLRAEISESEADIAELVRGGTDTAGDDQADTGSKTFEREHEMTLTNSHREMLSQTDRALSRIENGTYGVCENCGNAIGKARLQAFPRATLCLTCKQRAERR